MDYSHLADCMGSSSPSDALKYMTENMTGQDADSTIARAVFSFLTGKPDEAENCISKVKEEDIEHADLTRKELYGALLDRLSLGKYHTVPHWMLFKIRTGTELVYPFVPVFEKLEIKDNRFVLYLKDVCPSCKKKTILSENGFLVPLTSASDTVWYCPHCLAKREFSSFRVKNALWEQFRAFLARQPHREDGTLEENALSAVICMAQALYPLAPVRFGRLCTELIGHLVMNPSVYIQAKAKKVLAPTMDYIGVDYSGFMANAYLAEKWKEVFEFSPVGPQIFNVVQRTPLAVSELTTGPQFFFFDPEGLASETPAPFSFRLDEHVRARNELEKMGVPANAPFVCLHVRNKTYDEKYRPTSPDSSCRNADIDTYRLAAEFLAQQGYYVLRTGTDVPGPLEWASDHIIDYAVDHRSEFMDVWLFCNCDLCLSTGVGPDALSLYFRRPLIYSNYYQPVCYEMASFWNILFLPKTLVHIRNGRRVTCAEAARMQLIRHGPGSLEKFGIRTVDNTPEELLEAVKEKLALLNGTWTSDPLQEKLQDMHLALSISSLHYYCSPEQRENMWRMHSRKKGFARMTRIASCYLKADYEEECRRRGKGAGEV